MADNTIRRIDYFYATIQDRPGEAYQVLNNLAELGINLVALTVVPFGPGSTQMTIFPDDSMQLRSVAKNAGLALSGPHPAILVQGRDAVGALSDIHKTLYQAGVNVYASTGVSDGKGGFGYVIYIRPESYEIATQALRI